MMAVKAWDAPSTESSIQNKFFPFQGLEKLKAAEGLAPPLPWVHLSLNLRRSSSNWIRIGHVPAAIFYLRPHLPTQAPVLLRPLNGSEEATHTQDY